MKWVSRAAVLGAVALTCACGRDDPCHPHGVVVPLVSAGPATAAPSRNEPTSSPLMLAVSPAELDLAVGARDTVYSLATGLGDPRCGGVSSPAVGWSVGDAAVAAVQSVTISQGVVLGLAPGGTTVIATLLGEPTVKAAVVVHVR